jgi:hypothetical protein
MRLSGVNDWWDVAVDHVGGKSLIIHAEPENVAVYRQNIENLWALGTKPRPRQECISSAPDRESLGNPHVPAEQLCRPLAQDEISSSCRSWRGDDENGSNKHHGAIPLTESPVDIELRWRESESSATKFIGHYRLDLQALLSQGYIRHDSKLGNVRLQFVHDVDSIYIQHCAGQRWRVGPFV